MALIRPAGWPLFPGNRFISGINYPWFNYGSDFGLSQFQIRSKAGGDPRQGVSGAAHAAVETDLDEFNVANLQVIRWFLLCDCRAGVLFDDGRMGNSPGTPIGLESGVKADLTAALDLATSANLQLAVVLFDYLLCGSAFFVDPDTTKPSGPTGLGLFGHADLVSDTTKTIALLDTVVRPLVTAFQGHPQIFSWEIMNEPDLLTTTATLVNQGAPRVNTTMPGLTWTQVQDFLTACSRAIHSGDSNALVTVGGARLSNLDHLKVVPGLDYLQIHHYPDQMSGPDNAHDNLPTLSPPDRPLVIGEFCPTPGETLTQSVEHWFSMGAAGAWLWSWRDPRCRGRGSRPDLLQLQQARIDIDRVTRAATL